MQCSNNWSKTLPFGAVWDYHCATQGVPVGEAWLAEVKRYEKNVMNKRNRRTADLTTNKL
jgi:L-rhamnose isomerase